MNHLTSFTTTWDKSSWGEDGLPLILPSYFKVLNDLDMQVEFMGEQECKNASLLSRSDSWSIRDWVYPPTLVATECFSKLLADKENFQQLDHPVLRNSLKDPMKALEIPFLCTTWDILEKTFQDIEDIGRQLSESTLLDLLTLTDSPRAILDIAVTTPSWVCQHKLHIDKLSTITPMMPSDLEEALQIAALRQARMACMPNTLIEGTLWPILLLNRSGYSLTKRLTLEQCANQLDITPKRVWQVEKQYPFLDTCMRRWPIPNWMQSVRNHYEKSVRSTKEEAENKLFAQSFLSGSSAAKVLTDISLERTTKLFACYGHSINLEQYFII